MTRKLAALVAGLCAVWLVVLPTAALYFLVRIDDFGAMAVGNLAMPIQWYTVGNGQWYALWAITALFLALSYAGAWNLRKAFASFARGDWFDIENSRYLRRYATLLILQGVAKPVHFALASVILSLKHPAGERLLSISIGSDVAVLMIAGFILWVLADLLVEGSKADTENRQFV